MKPISLLVGLLSFAGLSSSAYSQVQAIEDGHKKDIHPHLVGHEDEILLGKIEDALADWDPRNLTSPYLKRVGTGAIATGGAPAAGKWPKYALRRPDLAEFIADPDAAVALGKALFWDMQAGSDFKRSSGSRPALGTACASCHYRFGADARDKNTYSIAFQTWSQFTANTGQPPRPSEAAFRPSKRPDYKPSFSQRSFDFEAGTAVLYSWFADVATAFPNRPGLRQHEIVGSQGMVLQRFGGNSGPKDGIAAEEKALNIASVTADKSYQPRSEMFRSGGNRTRQVTQRNSPSVINAVFNDRQFHDGRAESTFNGFSIFGDYDTDAVLKKAQRSRDGNWTGKSLPVRIAIPNASLASQAVGPIVNEVEMSYLGRTFHDVALKLLEAKPLATQDYTKQDSELDYIKEHKLVAYKDLIKKAFRQEWWHEETKVEDFPLYGRLQPGLREEDETTATVKSFRIRDDSLMINNFSLYWGLSIMLYQSTLVSNDSAFDKMMRGDETGVLAKWEEVGDKASNSPIKNIGNQATPGEPQLDGSGYGSKPGKRPDDMVRMIQLDRLPQLAHPPTLTPTATFQRGFRVFVRNCAECHEPPTFTTAGEVDLGPDIPKPIAKLHAHALVRTALADSFKERLMVKGFDPPAGVNDNNRGVLGDRNYFPDDDRLAELEGLGGPLMIENMGVPANRPASLFGGNAPRVPMITWLGTRPPLGFEPTFGKKGVDPYAFYDVSYYNIGVSEPRYDWGIWAFDGADEALTSEIIIDVAVKKLGLKLESANKLKALPPGQRANALTENEMAPMRQNMAREGITDESLNAALVETATAQILENTNELAGLPSLGSAYRLPRANRSRAAVPEVIKPELENKAMRLLRQQPDFNIARRAVDHSADRKYLDKSPLEKGGPKAERADHHFFKRARRMVMTEKPWGHRKHFINDNELMGWGAFKTPSLRNVALTEPYMHNGRFLTLRQVLAFYSLDNPDLVPAHRRLNPDLHPEMGRLDLNSDGLITGADGKPGGPLNLPKVHDAEALLFFLHCLTDESVVKEKAPFDHPSLTIVNGYTNDPKSEITVKINQVAAEGHKDNVPPQFPSSTDF